MMRTANRIDPLLERLRIVWKDSPDLRFGQLVMILQMLLVNPGDLFYIEDDIWDEAFDLMECATSYITHKTSKA